MNRWSKAGAGWRSQSWLELSSSTHLTSLVARAGGKRTTFWVGYKVHFTQTCDEDVPQLITHVETTHAAFPDGQALASIHEGEAARNVLPKHHLVDSGYVDSANLIQSRKKHDVDLVGPTLKNHWYQAETGYDLTHFSIDWEAETLTCPQGHSSASWTPAQNRRGHPVIKIKFSQTDCKACPSQPDCTSSTRRTLTLQPRQQMEALIVARQREGTADFKDLYRHRAGIEGVHSQTTRTMGLRRSRYIGLRKTHLGHVAIATAVNLAQLLSWLRGERPAQTRISPFKQLLKQTA